MCVGSGVGFVSWDLFEKARGGVVVFDSVVENETLGLGDLG